MRFYITALFAALCVLAGCQQQSSPVKFPPLRFQQYQPIHMAVSSIEFVEEYKSPHQLPNVEHLIPYSPAEAMQIWVRDRLRATGGDKYMKVIVKDGSVKVRQLSDGVSSIGELFSSGPDKQYDASLIVQMRVYGESPIAEADIEVKTHRTIVIPESASANDREAALRKMTNDMMTGANAEIEKNLYQYMSNYISYWQSP